MKTRKDPTRRVVLSAIDFGRSAVCCFLTGVALLVLGFAEAHTNVDNSNHRCNSTMLPTVIEGLHIVTAYCTTESERTTTVRMTTSHLQWKSYSPFSDGDAWCAYGAQRGSNLITNIHETRCTIPNSNISSVTVMTAGGTCITFECVRKPKKYLGNFVGLTEARNSADLREWASYHLKNSYFDYIVVYDDCSDPPIQLSDMENVTVTSLPHFCEHKGRQFVAMQDFLYNFHAEWVMQIDDDCFLDKNDRLTAVLEDPSVAQVTIASSFYGACVHKNDELRYVEGNDRCAAVVGDFCAIDHRAPNESILNIAKAYSAPPSKAINWRYGNNKTRRLNGGLSIARMKKITRASGGTHYWHTSGKTVDFPPSIHHFKHIKLLPLKEYLEKISHRSSWGSVSPMLGQDPAAFWQQLAKQVCVISVDNDNVTRN